MQVCKIPQINPILCKSGTHSYSGGVLQMIQSANVEGGDKVVAAGESRNLIVFGLKEEEEEGSPLISAFLEVVERELISK